MTFDQTQSWHPVRLLLGLCLCVFVSFPLTSCQRFEPIKIGFVDGLTGAAADLGQDTRDGATLAVEKYNAHGGLNGRKVVLVIKDDQHEPEAAKRAVRELIDERVVAIVGHGTSNTAMETAAIADAAGMVMVSPTVTTKALSGKYLHFFRVVSATDKYAKKAAQFHRRVLKSKTMAIAYDTRNMAYTKSWGDDFQHTFHEEGGTTSTLIPFESISGFAIDQVANRLLAKKPDGIMIVANATDAANLVKAIRARDAKVNIGTSEWAATENLIKLGGSAVEGIYSTQFIDRNSRKAEYVTFRAAYLQRFKREPGFGSVMAYDAVNVILAGLEKNPDPKRLAQTLASVDSYAGLQAPIRFDAARDADRPSYITVVLNGQFRTYEN